MILKEFRQKRSRLQMYTSWGLPAVVIGGWFYPPLGFFLFMCMLGAVGLAVYKGRAWCDWMCPRGSFYDSVLTRLTRNRKVPALMKTRAFRSWVLVGLLLALGLQLYFAWGDAGKMGLALVRVLTITTTAGIVLGAVFQQRAWCHICPMGTLGNWISKGAKKPIYVSENCKSCKLCSKVCPMELKPYEYKDGIMTEGDCIKCGTCIWACPIKALKFGEPLRKAA